MTPQEAMRAMIQAGQVAFEGQPLEYSDALTDALAATMLAALPEGWWLISDNGTEWRDKLRAIGATQERERLKGLLLHAKVWYSDEAGGWCLPVDVLERWLSGPDHD